jgi:polyisoprenoid-binding protein YceI
MRFVLPVLLMATGPLSGGSAADFSIDAASSDVYVQLRPADGPILNGLSHHHVIVARRIEGDIHWDPQAPDACRVRVDVPIAGLDVDPERKRAALGFEKSMSDGDRKKTAKNMKAKDQLWADRHPVIEFRSARCEADGEGIVRVDGKLSIRGVGKSLSLPVKIEPDAKGLRARVDFEQVHGDFGFEPYSALFGALKNEDSLRFHVDIRAVRTSTTSD